MRSQQRTTATFFNPAPEHEDDHAFTIKQRPESNKAPMGGQVKVNPNFNISLMLDGVDGKDRAV